MQVIGIHSLGHDTGVSLWENGRLLVSFESERWSRKRFCGDVRFAFKELEKSHHFRPNEVVLVAVSSYFNHQLLEINDHLSVMEKLLTGLNHIETQCTVLGKRYPCVIISHEAGHASIALHQGGMQENSLVLVNEGKGIFSRNSLYLYKKNKLSLIDHDFLPWYGTGFGWTALASLFGLKKSPGAAGNIMAYSGYGNPNNTDKAFLLNIRKDLHKISYPEQVGYMEELFLSKEFSFAEKASLMATFQQLFTDSILDYTKKAIHDYKASTLCLGGGCALNIVTNAKLRRELSVPVFIPAACNDSGQAVGVAIYAQQFILNIIPQSYSPYCNGEAESTDAIVKHLKGLNFNYRDYDEGYIAQQLSRGAVVSYFQGKAEIGPRSLGNRSILANANIQNMKEHVSSNIKKREYYRPLAPIITIENFKKLYPNDYDSELMLFNYDAKSLRAPEATHADGSARIQTITKEFNPRLHQLLESYNAVSGHVALINTSLNAGGKPIAQTCLDVFDDFLDEDITLFVFNEIMWCKNEI